MESQGRKAWHKNLRVAEELISSSSSYYLKELQTVGWVNDVSALSAIKVTPFGCQRANGVLNFWRES